MAAEKLAVVRRSSFLKVSAADEITPLQAGRIDFIIADDTMLAR